MFSDYVEADIGLEESMKALYEAEKTGDEALIRQHRTEAEDFRKKKREIEEMHKKAGIALQVLPDFGVKEMGLVKESR